MANIELELPDPCQPGCHLVQESWDAAGLSSRLEPEGAPDAPDASGTAPA